jgi:hypothetical protein
MLNKLPSADVERWAVGRGGKGGAGAPVAGVPGCEWNLRPGELEAAKTAGLNDANDFGVALSRETLVAAGEFESFSGEVPLSTIRWIAVVVLETPGVMSDFAKGCFCNSFLLDSFWLDDLF